MPSLDTIREFMSWFSRDPVTQAATVAVMSLIAAKVVDLVISRFVKRAVGKTETELDDRIIELLHRPIFVSVALIGFLIALELLSPSVITEDTERYGKAGFITLIVLVWTSFFVRLTSLMVGWMSQEDRRFKFVQPATAPLFDIGAKVVVGGVFLYLILAAWKIDVTGLLTSAGIMGLALGLAAKDTLSNLFAGVSILADSPYKIGDFIILDNAERGQVVKIGLRSTRILTRDQVEVTVPNAVIAQNKIINESGGPSPSQRIRLPVSVAYGTDADFVSNLLMKVAEESPMISKTEGLQVQFKGFGTSELQFELRAWVDEPVLRGRVIHALNTAVYKALNEAKVEIPYPKRDLYIKELPPGLKLPEKN